MKRIAILFITKSPNSWHETFSTLKALRKFYCTSEPPLYFLYQTLWTGPMSLSLISLAVIITLGRSAPEFIPLSQAPSADHLWVQLSTTVRQAYSYQATVIGSAFPALPSSGLWWGSLHHAMVQVSPHLWVRWPLHLHSRSSANFLLSKSFYKEHSGRILVLCNEYHHSLKNLYPLFTFGINFVPSYANVVSSKVNFTEYMFWVCNIGFCSYLPLVHRSPNIQILINGVMRLLRFCQLLI